MVRAVRHPLKRSLQSFAELVDVELVAQDAAFKVWQHAAAISPDGRPGVPAPVVEDRGAERRAQQSPPVGRSARPADAADR